MKSIEEITREEYEQMKVHHRKYSYTNDEIAGLFNLVRAYVDPRQQTCVTCTANLRDAKIKLNEFYLSNTERIEQILADREKPIEIVQVEKYQQEIKPEQKKRGPKKKNNNPANTND